MNTPTLLQDSLQRAFGSSWKGFHGGLLFLSALLLCLMIWRISWYQDEYAVESFLLSVLLGMVILIDAGIHDEAKTIKWKTIARVVSIVAFALILQQAYYAFAYISASGSGVWVAPESRQTTVAAEHINLQWGQKERVSFVPYRFWVYTDVQVNTRDEVPLICSIFAAGISLDLRDARGLEEHLFKLSAVRDPQRYLESEIVHALGKSAVAVLGAKNSDDITRQGSFLIPYQIGTPLRNTLAHNLLRWDGGEVAFQCSLQKFKS